jgi:indole-3-glycerol phosphate synthase
MMNTTDDLAPPVRSILAAARARSVPEGRVDADAASLADALAGAAADGRVPVIAEVKPTSPTTDGRRVDDPVELAESMVAGGAAALSVLTEPEHIGGSPETLERVRAAVDVPVLRKDFVLAEAGLDAVAADAVLLIARFVDDLPELVEAARERGMEPLVEVHTAGELERAVAADAALIGVNNRDLARLTVDRSTFERVGPDAPDDVTLIAESGIQTPAHVQRMREAGADGLLIGSAIMADDDVTAGTRRLVSA